MTNKQTVETIKGARDRAKKIIEAFDMNELLEKNMCWENPQISVLTEEDGLTDDNLDDEESVSADNHSLPQFSPDSEVTITEH